MNLDTVFQNSPRLEDKCLQPNPECIHRFCWASLSDNRQWGNEAPHKWQQHASLWATLGHCSPHELAIKSNHVQVTLQDSSTSPDTGVTKPMSDKSSAHGIKRGVFECPFYIYKNTQSRFLVAKHLPNLNHKLMKCRFLGFPSLLIMLVGMRWH